MLNPNQKIVKNKEEEEMQKISFLVVCFFLVIPVLVLAASNCPENYWPDPKTGKCVYCGEDKWFDPVSRKCITPGDDPTGETDRNFQRLLRRERGRK